MPSFINNLWVITQDGTPLVEIFNNEQLNTGLLGAFLSAIESYSKKISDGGKLTSITFKEKKLVIIPALGGYIYLVGLLNKSLKDKKIKEIFKIISDIFEDLYSENDIKTWDGDISFFDKFEERINIYFRMYDL